MARSTGIEITETSVRVVDLDGSPRKCRLLGAAEAPIATAEAGEDGGEGRRGQEQIVQAVRAALKASRARRDQVILGIPASRAVIREIVIPFTDVEQIKKVIKFESESHLPSGNIEDVVVAFHKIGETGPRSRVLIIAVQKSVLAEYIEVLARVGIDPAQIDLDAAALFARSRLLSGLDGEDEREAQVILDVGQSATTVTVATGPHLRLVRSMRLGADSLTRTLSQDLGIDRAEARTVTARILGTAEHPFTTAGEAEAGEPSRALTAVQLRQDIIKDKEQGFARRLAAELRRSLSSVQLEGRVAGIWLTGAASAAPGLERELTHSFQVPVRPLDILHDVDHKLPPASAASYGTALGLALKGLGHDPLRIDFRQEELRFTRRFDKVRNPLFFALALILVLFTFLAINEFNDHKELRIRIQKCAGFGTSSFDSLIVQRVPNSASVLGYTNLEDAQKKLQDILKAKPQDRLARVLTELRKPTDILSREYGIAFGEEEASQAPELEARSALYRLDQFLGAFGRAKAEIGRFTIDRLEVSSTSIAWTMSVERPGGFTILQKEFEKLAEYVSSDTGKLKTQANMQVYENARLDFKPER